MFYVRKLNKDLAGYRIYIPPSFIRELKWRPCDPLIVYIDKTGKIIIDRITPEKYPDFFKVDLEEIKNNE
jgi:bifunctional DNA-binding transcriptional regulator/antitoxin component of YhaV-PrlF toxin-antitoxin module